MSTCKSCMQMIDDLRRETRCTSCSAPLHRVCAIKEDDKYFCDVCYTVKEEEPPTESFDIPDVIRRSYIETYASCPFKFYMEVIKGVEQPHTIYTQLGVDIHVLVDRLCNHGLNYPKDEMLYDFHKEYWNNYTDELFETEALKIKMYNRALSSIDNAYEIIPSMPKPLATEEKILFSVGDGLPKISTTLDRIDASGNEIEIHDWKTGAVMVGQKLSTDMQVPLYIYGARQAYEKPVKRFTLHYLQDKKQRVFERVTNDDYVCTVRKKEYHVNITDVIRRVQSLFSHIIKGNFNIPRDAKGMYFTCKMCNLRQIEACQGAELESWKQNYRR